MYEWVGINNVTTCQASSFVLSSLLYINSLVHTYFLFVPGCQGPEYAIASGMYIYMYVTDMFRAVTFYPCAWNLDEAESFPFRTGIVKLVNSSFAHEIVAL